MLPLLVPDGEALGTQARGRATDGLLGRALEALGARVREVELDATEETSAGARVRLAQGGREVEVPARPSESIALALAAGVPIFTTRRLLAKSGLTPAELREAHEALSAKASEPRCGCEPGRRAVALTRLRRRARRRRARLGEKS